MPTSTISTLRGRRSFFQGTLGKMALAVRAKTSTAATAASIQARILPPRGVMAACPSRERPVVMPQPTHHRGSPTRARTAKGCAWTQRRTAGNRCRRSSSPLLPLSPSSEAAAEAVWSDTVSTTGVGEPSFPPLSGFNRSEGESKAPPTSTLADVAAATIPTAAFFFHFFLRS